MDFLDVPLSSTQESRLARIRKTLEDRGLEGAALDRRLEETWRLLYSESDGKWKIREVATTSMGMKFAQRPEEVAELRSDLPLLPLPEDFVAVFVDGTALVASEDRLLVAETNDDLDVLYVDPDSEAEAEALFDSVRRVARTPGSPLLASASLALHRRRGSSRRVGGV